MRTILFAAILLLSHTATRAEEVITLKGGARLTGFISEQVTGDDILTMQLSEAEIEVAGHEGDSLAHFAGETITSPARPMNVCGYDMGRYVWGKVLREAGANYIIKVSGPRECRVSRQAIARIDYPAEADSVETENAAQPTCDYIQLYSGEKIVGQILSNVPGQSFVILTGGKRRKVGFDDIEAKGREMEADSAAVIDTKAVADTIAIADTVAVADSTVAALPEMVQTVVTTYGVAVDGIITRYTYGAAASVTVTTRYEGERVFPLEDIRAILARRSEPGEE